MTRYAAPLQKGDDLLKVAKAIATVYGEFELIHPYREGNGRIGRLITDLMALQAGYPPLLFGISDQVPTEWVNVNCF